MLTVSSTALSYVDIQMDCVEVVRKAQNATLFSTVQSMHVHMSGCVHETVVN